MWKFSAERSQRALLICSLRSHLYSLVGMSTSYLVSDIVIECRRGDPTAKAGQPARGSGELDGAGTVLGGAA